MSKQQTTTDTTNQENIFTAKQLPTFSPYQVKSIDTKTKPVSGTSSDGKKYSFDSKNHILTIRPMQNEKILVKVNVFDEEYQQLKALATIHEGFDKCWITTAIDPSSTSRKTKFIHTAQSAA